MRRFFSDQPVLGDHGRRKGVLTDGVSFLIGVIVIRFDGFRMATYMIVGSPLRWCCRSDRFANGNPQKLEWAVSYELLGGSSR